MDPITQTAIGAAVAIAISPKEQTRLAAFLGAIAGAVPDLDILIRSDTDPLMVLQYHRHFSHALIIAPLIGICIAVIFRLIMLRSKVPFKKYVFYATAGALTHGLIDACTSYGTLLYWPFSNYRESWNLISVIDPLFTLPLVLLTLIALKCQRPFFARFAVLFCLVYLGFCGYQKVKATETMQNLAAKRGHEPDKYTVHPSIANNVLWRTIYRHNGRYYVDAIRVFFDEKPRVYKGHSVAEFSIKDALNLAPPDSILGNDIERFWYFSQGNLYLYPGEANMLCDLRYSVYPDSILPLWGIIIDPAHPETHAEFRYFGKVSKIDFIRFRKMISGREVDEDDSRAALR